MVLNQNRSATVLTVVTAFVGCVLLLLCPPWVDEHGYGIGLAFAWSPPVPFPDIPVRLPNGEMWTPRPPGPPAIDWATVVRGELLIGLVALGFMRLRKSNIRSSSARNVVKALLLAVVLPIPVPVTHRVPLIPPLGMHPVEMYTGSNHGIPGFVLMAFALCALAFWLYLAIEAGGWLRRKLRGA